MSMKTTELEIEVEVGIASGASGAVWPRTGAAQRYLWVLL